MITTYAELEAASRSRKPRVTLILGSGLGDIADQLDDAVTLPFGGVPGLEASSVPGHRGALSLGMWSRVPVLVFAGRLHGYEGHAWRTVVQPVHIAHSLGASILLATNAAGGIRTDLQAGDLMAIRGHIDATREAWWRDGDWIQTTPYSSRLLNLLPLRSGIYAQLTGPSYETPAEIRALCTCGADAVGMSTAREIEAGFKLGMECAAISCITNKAAGLGNGPIHHDEVLETGRRVKATLIELLRQFIIGVHGS
ncbi:MAG TPA: purine-nucleoside phosphorylase [Gemmataceae bacterium]|nr:purine-nucleoside phosphorylase [Gemmataceae bacterium]